jgi:uncharacterized protein YwgA
MNRGRILLKLVLDQAGAGQLSLDTFADRLSLQKRIYLIQLSGVDFGYRYNWYLRGPYCPALTRDAFLLKDEVEGEEKEYTTYELTDSAIEKIHAVQKIWDLPGGLGVSPEDWLELLASLHYLKHVAYWPGNNVAKERIFQKLVEAKPHFAERPDLIEAAWSRLDESGLITKKSLRHG